HPALRAAIHAIALGHENGAVVAEAARVARVLDDRGENGAGDVVGRAAGRLAQYALETLVAEALAARVLAIGDSVRPERDHVLRPDLDLLLLVSLAGNRAQRRAADLEPAHRAPAGQERPRKTRVGERERVVARVVHAVRQGEEAVAHARQAKLLVHVGEQ